MVKIFLQTAEAVLISWYLVCGGGNAQIGCCGVAGNIGGVASKGVGLASAEDPLRSTGAAPHRCAGPNASVHCSAGSPMSPHTTQTCCESNPCDNNRQTGAIVPCFSVSASLYQSRPTTTLFETGIPTAFSPTCLWESTRTIPIYILYRSFVR
jgi:hypothetical protein